MGLSSWKQAPGRTIVAQHHNDLRDDLVDNHTHEAGLGGAIDHKDLAETGVMADRSKSHQDIDTHITGKQATGEDSGGGDQGVHGLADDEYVLGYIGHTTQTEGGGASLDDSFQGKLMCGAYWSHSRTFNVYYGIQFSSTPKCFVVVPSQESFPEGLRPEWRVYGINENYAQVWTIRPGKFQWIAVGEV
jgi:hypothetical protein